MKVPHVLIATVSAELNLEEKARRIAHKVFPEGYSQAAVVALAQGLKLAHQAAYGKSNLTAWRIVNEWNDTHATIQLERLLIGNTGELARTRRLRQWEQDTGWYCSGELGSKSNSQTQNQI